MKTVILVTGDRDWTNIDVVVEALSQHVGHDVLVVEGECRGADIVCRAVAEELGFQVDKNPAAWRDSSGNFRRWAGLERNQQMLDKHKHIDVCYAFHDNIFVSRGTKDMLKRVIVRGINRKLWSTPVASIEGFSDKFRYLSNFFPVNVKLDNETYPSIEHAYQAAKTLDLEKRLAIKKLSKPADAKRAGKVLSVRDDWNDVKIDVMMSLLLEKFSQDFFKDAILSTRNAELVESNTWNDEYWGVCRGKGQNMLGKLLMETRSVLYERSRSQDGHSDANRSKHASR